MDSALRRRSLLAGLGVALAGCASDTEDDPSEPTPTPDDEREPLTGSWPTFARDGENTGYASDIDGPYTEIGQAWEFETASAITASPAIDGNTLYVGSTDGAVYALDPYVGVELWSFETDGPIAGTPAIVDGTLYIGSADTHLYAIDTDDGTERWRFETGGRVDSSPTVADGTVYVGTVSSAVFAVDRETGDERWRFGTGASVLGAPAVSDETVYAGSGDQRVYAIDADGSQRWSFDTRGTVAGGPTIDGETVYALDDQPFAVAEEYPDRDRYRYAFRGFWNPPDGSPQAARVQPVTVVRGEQLSLDTTLGTPAGATSVTVRLSGADGTSTYYGATPTDGSVSFTVDVTDDTLTLVGADGRTDSVVRPDDGPVVATAFIDYPGGTGFTYRVEMPVERVGGETRALSPELEWCRDARACDGAAAYVPGHGPEGIFVETALDADPNT